MSGVVRVTSGFGRASEDDTLRMRRGQDWEREKGMSELVDASDRVELTKNAVAEELKNEAALKSGAGWFYWIAGFSLVNSVVLFCGGDISFVVGLGITMLADVVGGELGGMAVILAAVFNVIVAGVFVVFGLYGRKGRRWAFLVGMILYGLDGLLLLAAGDYFAAGFHGFALFGIYGGLKALRLVPQQQIKSVCNVSVEDVPVEGGPIYAGLRGAENSTHWETQVSGAGADVGPAPTIGLAIASLVLGIVAVLLSLMVIGGVFGLIGLTVGIWHMVAKSRGRVMAGFGIGLSVVGVLLSVVFATAYYELASQEVLAEQKVAATSDPAGGQDIEVAMVGQEQKETDTSSTE